MDKRGQTSALVVDDDAAIRRLLRNLFEPEGIAVIEARSSEEVFSAIQENDVGVILLDLMLNGEDGLRIARDVRARCDTPIIIVSAKGEDVDRIVGLEIGADDYIVKPFSLREVLARTRAVLRRTERSLSPPASAAPVYEFHHFKMDLARRQLKCTNTGEEIALTSQEFDLLEVFCNEPNVALTRSALLDKLGGAAHITGDRAIDTLVARLRKKIEIATDRPELIKTVRSLGYLFDVDVKRR